MGGGQQVAVRPPAQSTKMSEAQAAMVDLRREELAAQKEQAGNTMLANILFKSLGFVERAVYEGVRYGRDPEAVRTARAFEEQWQDTLEQLQPGGAAEAREDIAQAKIEGEAPPPPSMEPDPLEPTSTLGTRWSRPGPAPSDRPPRQREQMSSEDAAAFQRAVPAMMGALKAEGSMASLENALADRGYDKAQIPAAIKQLAWAHDNWQSLTGGENPAIQVTEGAATGHWGDVADVAGRAQKFKEGKWGGAKIAKSFPRGGKGFDFSNRLRQLTEKGGPEKAKAVMTELIQKPGAPEMVMAAAEEKLGGSEEWEVIKKEAGELIAARDWAAVIDVMTPVLLAEEGAFEPTYKDLPRARELTPAAEGGATQYPEAGSFSVMELPALFQTAVAKGDKAMMARLIDPELIKRASGLGAVPGVTRTGGAETAMARIQGWIQDPKGVEVRRGRDPLKTAGRYVQAATAGMEREFKQEELDIKRIRASMLQSRKEWARSAAASKASGDLEAVYASDWFKIVAEEDGLVKAKKYAGWQADKKTSVAKTEAGRKRAEAIIDARKEGGRTDAAQKKSKSAWLKGRRQFRADIQNAKKAKRKLLAQFGGRGDRLTIADFSRFYLAKAKKAGGSLDIANQYIDDNAQTEVNRINKAILKLEEGLIKEATDALELYDETHPEY